MLPVEASAFTVAGGDMSEHVVNRCIASSTLPWGLVRVSLDRISQKKSKDPQGMNQTALVHDTSIFGRSEGNEMRL